MASLARGAAVRRLISPQAAMLPPLRPAVTPSVSPQIQARRTVITGKHHKVRMTPVTAAMRRSVPTPSVQAKGHPENVAHTRTFYESFLITGHFIRPAWAHWPKLREGFFPFAYAYLHTKFMDRLIMAQHKWASKPSVFKRAAYQRIGDATLIGVARDLHSRMNMALAAGDLPTLKTICVLPLATTLCAQVGKRPRGVGFRWRVDWRAKHGDGGAEVMSHKLLPTGYKEPGSQHSMKLVQAVVRLRSTQERENFSMTTKQVIPGSLVKAECVENLVITGVLDNTPRGRVTRWRVFGTVKDTTPESWAKDKERLQKLTDAQIKETSKKFPVIGKMLGAR